MNTTLDTAETHAVSILAGKHATIQAAADGAADLPSRNTSCIITRCWGGCMHHCQ